MRTDDSEAGEAFSASTAAKVTLETASAVSVALASELCTRLIKKTLPKRSQLM